MCRNPPGICCFVVVVLCIREAALCTGYKERKSDGDCDETAALRSCRLVSDQAEHNTASVVAAVLHIDGSIIIIKKKKKP